MGPKLEGEVAGPAEVTPILDFEDVSKWYGNVIGVNKLTLSVWPGVTGLLGPNGAGKSTMLQLATGQLRASQGVVRVLGQPVWNNPRLMHRIGLCPEQDAFYEWMNGSEFVHLCARLSGMPGAEARAATDYAIEVVGMTQHKTRPIRGYSKGMRQRIKIAQALVHDPDVLFLDEPLTGTDPIARREIIDVILKLAQRGKSVLVSSHVLHEVQAITQSIILLNRGRLVAEGNIRQIRDLIDKHPHRIVLVCADYRRLASEVLAWDDVEGVKVLREESAVLVETRTPDAFYGRLPELALRGDTGIREVYSDDDNLEAVFRYLVQS